MAFDAHLIVLNGLIALAAAWRRDRDAAPIKKPSRRCDIAVGGAEGSAGRLSRELAQNLALAARNAAIASSEI